MPVALSIRELLQQVAEPFTGEALFDQLADVVYFIKNAAAQYVVVNQTFVRRCGFRSKSQLLGRTPSEVLPPPFGGRFESQDRAVLRSGRPLLGQLELHAYPNYDVGWCLTNKMPLLDRAGQIIGLVGISQDLKLPDSTAGEFQNILAAVEHAEKNISDPLTVQDLAGIAGLSRFQLDRRMQSVYGLTAGQWLLKLRLDHARRLLSETTDTIAAVSLQAGYSDQSAFSRQFRHATGLTPREFRTAGGLNR
jgi:AraC-like DNA-binding protein